jgi:carbamate kinase
MLVVIALGNNAILRRGEAATADNQRASVRKAAQAFAPIAAKHQLVIAHGKGPQAVLLALQGAACAKVETPSLDTLGAQTDAVIGYLVEQELGNLLPPDRSFATIVTMVEVDPADPAFRKPATFIGPVYLREEAERFAREKGWVFKPVGDKWRRVVASPQPQHIFELRPIKWLLEHDTVVIVAGGGGIPATYDKATRRFAAVECVVDQDLACELLARELGADLFVMLTDTDAVYVHSDERTRNAITRASPDALIGASFAAESMRRHTEAACRFATATGKTAAIGAVPDLERIVAGRAGTMISTVEPRITFAPAARLPAGALQH